ncbi:MAG: TIM-barrel domain-containing protein [Vicinamibacterales bacterium]
MLKQFVVAGAGTMLGGGVIRGQQAASPVLAGGPLRPGGILAAPIRVAGVPVEIVVAAVSPAMVRITVAPILDTGVPPQDGPKDPTGRLRGLNDGALVPAAEGKRVTRRRGERFQPIAAGNLSVRYTGDPPTIHVSSAQGQAIQKIVLSAEEPGVAFSLPAGPLLGLGEGGPQFDRNGSIDRMRNGQGGYQLRTHGGRVPIQWLVGTDGWGLFIHHPLGSFDLSGTEGRLLPFADALPIDLFVVASRDPATIMREYARITGFAELPPLWSFGYMQSHRTLAGPEEVMRVADTFREKKLPCDALIYLGTEFTPSGWNTRNGEFDWKKENFPDPRSTISALHERHYKVVLHIVIEGRRMSGAAAGACTPEKAVPSGRTPDNRWPEDRAVECYWPYHKPLMDLGVDGWWPDQGDGLDAPSRLARIRMYWEGPQRYRPNERPFALHRNGYAGMQRYGAFLWSGDVYSTWETLKTHVPVAINTGLSGIPFWGTDIGGFVPTPEYTGELHVRWFQFGTFTPSFRAHGRTWHLRLPWGWNTGTLGPDELRGYTGGAGYPDPSELRNPEVEPIVRKYLELRYRLLAYTYTVAKECCETGLPMIRSLWLHYPQDATAAARGDQFLWGRDILVSPVVEKGAASRTVYLPRGAWYDYWTEERLDGGREIERKVDLATMPLHVRAGTILPLAAVREYVEQPIPDPLTIVVYPGADGAFTLYEDDGRSFDYRKGELMRIAMTWRDADRRLSFRLAPGTRMLPPLRRPLQVRLAASTETREVVFEGRALEVGF